MIDFIVGEELELKAAAVNPINPDEIWWQPGTRVKIISVEKDKVGIEFPDGDKFWHEPWLVIAYFNLIKNDNPVYVKRTVKIGNLDKNLADYFPVEADWKKKYKTTVIVEIEDMGFKKNICYSCQDDLGENPKQNDEGMSWCPKCDLFVPAINPLNFEYPTA